ELKTQTSDLRPHTSYLVGRAGGGGAGRATDGRHGEWRERREGGGDPVRRNGVLGEQELQHGAVVGGGGFEVLGDGLDGPPRQQRGVHGSIEFDGPFDG